MEIAVGYLLKALVLPPGGNLLLVLFGAWLRRRRARSGNWLIRVALGSLMLMMLPPIALLIAKPLEPAHAFDVARGPAGAGAIVILGGGMNPLAPEYGDGPVLLPRTLERLCYGVYLHRWLGLPIALVGGAVIYGAEPEGMLMYRVINEDFHVPARWVEADSRNTAENAAFARKLLPVDRILLVTHALHMRRARRMFEAAGFDVVPAPLGFRTDFDLAMISVFDFIPSVDALSLVHDALHEYLGLLWYRLRY